MGDYGALSARHYDLITLMDAPVDQYHINCCSQARQGFHLKEKEILYVNCKTITQVL